jgi:hypothetical protein
MYGVLIAIVIIAVGLSVLIDVISTITRNRDKDR